MEKKEFKAESKRLLDLMINSIYTQKEIFLRELISNSSDAIDKIYYKALTDENISFNKDDYYIQITPDMENRTLTISDTGIGMTKEELEENLGIIAQSGSLEFKKENESKDGVDIIGQFGVGFYSAFMVSDRVTVISKAFGEEIAYKWESEGAEGYTIDPCEKDTVGTDIILKIKDNTDDEDYDEFLQEQRLMLLVKKYSDFIRYPIKMNITKQKPKENSEEDSEKDSEEEFEEYVEEEVVNSMIPIWRKNKSELTDEDYNKFYIEKHLGYEDPLKSIHVSFDGAIRFNAILFIPSSAPYRFYSAEYEKGLELYSSGVLIMDKCSDLLPDYFNFVQGVVDSEDLSLNISREMLQQDRQLKLIAKKINDKIKEELLLLLKKDRDKYDKFYENFGRQLKYGVYSEFGNNKEMLQDLLMFYSSKQNKMITLDEYVSGMSEEQKYIYYASGESNDRISKLPQTEVVAEKGFDILYLTEDVDEFAIRMMMNYKEKEFKSVSSSDLGIESEEADEETDSQKEEDKELFDFMKETLSGKVVDVRSSKRLKKHPVCLASDGELSIEMEKILSNMPDNGGIKADKVLEINVNHDVFAALKDSFENDKEKLKMYTELLYNQALLIEGLPMEDPVKFTNDICELMK